MMPGYCSPRLVLPHQRSPDGLLHRDGGTTLAACVEPAPRVEGVHAAVQPRKAFQHGQRHLSLRLLQEPQQDLLARGAGKERESSGDLALPTACPPRTPALQRDQASQGEGKAKIALEQPRTLLGMLWSDSSSICVSL